MSKLGLFCERLIEAGWLVAVAIVALYFDIYSSRVFEPDKISLLRSLVVVMAVAQIVKWLDATRDRPSSAAQPAASPPAVPRWRRWSKDTPLAIPILLLVLTYLVGTAFSVTPGMSLWGSYQRLQGTYTMLVYVVLFFLMAGNLRHRAQIERLFTVIILVSLPISLYGIVQHLRLDPLPWGGDVTFRVTSTMGNAIFLGAYLIMVVPLSLQRLVHTLHRLRSEGDLPAGNPARDLPPILSGVAALFSATAFLAILAIISATLPNTWWPALPAVGLFAGASLLFRVRRATRATLLAEATGYVLALALQLAAIVLTQSRGPEIGLMVGLAVFAIVLAVRRGARRPLAGSVALGAVALAFLVLLNIPQSPLGPLKEMPYISRLGQLLETDSGTGRVRVLIWQGTLDLLRAPPPLGTATSDPLGPARVLVGWGPESMYVVFNKVYPADLAHYEVRNASPDRNHNGTLDYAMNTGLLGLSAYLFLVFAVLRLVWRRIWAAPDMGSQLPLIAILSALVAHFVESQVGIVIAVTWTLFWAYLAIIARADVMHSDRAPSQAALEAAPAAASVASATSAFGKRRVRRQNAANLAARAGERSEATGETSPYLRAAWLSFLLGLGLATFALRVSPPMSDFAIPLDLSFLGLLLVVALIALSLRPRLVPRPAGKVGGSAYILGSLAVVIAGFIVVLNLSVVAADIYFKRGLAFDKNRNFVQTILDYNKALALAGGEDYYYLFLGRAYVELAKATQRPPANPPFQPTVEGLRELNGSQLVSIGREDLLNAGRVVLEEALRLAPLNPDHHANLGRLYRSWAEMGNPSKLPLADKYYRDVILVRPAAAHLWHEWGLTDQLAGNLDGALAKAKRAIEIDPYYAPSYVLLGDLKLQAGETTEAYEAHSRAVALDPVSLLDTRIDMRINAYEQAALLPKLETILADALRGAPGQPGLHAAYGYVLFRENKMEESVQAFLATVQISPDDWVAHRNLALAYQALGKFDQAIASVQNAQRSAPQEQQAGLQSHLADLQQRKPR